MRLSALMLSVLQSRGPVHSALRGVPNPITSEAVELTQNTQIVSALIDVEGELRRLCLWDAEPPHDDALASVQPFAIDTLSFPQWLQFIFLPNMYRLIEADGELPQRCGILPMAEESFRGKKLDVQGLFEALGEIDKLLSDGEPDYSIGG